TFVYLGKDYATDGENVYFRGELIESADGKTFKVIDGPEFFYFGVDHNNVFKHDEIFEEADPATFYFDRDDKRTIGTEYEHKYIIGDKNKEWLYVPPDSFKKVRKK
ncbi:MAG: DKNYY domain-containing protein, partial [Bacteroidota bacterium]